MSDFIPPQDLDPETQAFIAAEQARRLERERQLALPGGRTHGGGASFQAPEPSASAFDAVHGQGGTVPAGQISGAMREQEQAAAIANLNAAVQEEAAPTVAYQPTAAPAGSSDPILQGIQQAMGAAALGLGPRGGGGPRTTRVATTTERAPTPEQAAEEAQAHARIEAGEQRQIDAKTAAAEARAVAAAQEAEAIRAARTEGAELEAERDAERAQAQQAMTRYRETTDRMIEDIEGQRIGPSEVWTERGTGAQVLASISIALSGIGNAIAVAGGAQSRPNSALAIIERGIDREVAAQRAQIANRWRGIEGRRTVYQQMRAEMESDDQAAIATRQALWADVGRQAEQFSAFAKTTEERAAAQQFRGALEAQRAGLDEQAIQATQTVIQTQRKTATGGGGGGPRPSLQAMNAYIAAFGQLQGDAGDVQAGTEAISEAMVRHHIPQLLQQVNRLDAFVQEGRPLFTGPIAGADTQATLTGTRFRDRAGHAILATVSPDSIEYAQTANQLAVDILFAFSGKQTNEEERKRIILAYGLAPHASEVEVRRGLIDLRADIAASQRAIMAGQIQAAQDLFSRRTGVDFTGTAGPSPSAQDVE